MNATMSLDNKKHYPVMLDQVLSIISPQHGGTFIDCTFGGGGYSRAILKYPGTKVFAIDRDKITEHYANDLSKKFPDRFNFFRSKFSDLNQVISSIQLLDNQRSFSFNSKSFLSMEMGINKYTAYDVINSLDKRYLANIIKIFGEEKDGKIIANAINKHRIKNSIKTSEELSKIIKSAKKNYNNFKKNPATKTFQAIRIFVNQELTELILGLIEATRILKKDGILIVVSFHSLEDKIVKYFFNLYSNLKKNPSRYLPSKENKSQLFKLLSKKPLIPSQKEIYQNKNSRSAKLRYVIRDDNSFFYPKEFKNKFQDYFNLEAINL
jgi:16S rRNA (cytosine1402-N4)-methyltransferase